MTKLEQNQASTPFLNYMYLTGDLSITNEVKSALKTDQLYTPAVCSSFLCSFVGPTGLFSRRVQPLPVHAQEVSRRAGRVRLLVRTLQGMPFWLLLMPRCLPLSSRTCPATSRTSASSRSMATSVGTSPPPSVSRPSPPSSSLLMESRYASLCSSTSQVHKIQGADVQGIQQAIQQYGYCAHPDTLPPQ